LVLRWSDGHKGAGPCSHTGERVTSFLISNELLDRMKLHFSWTTLAKKPLPLIAIILVILIALFSQQLNEFTTLHH